MSRVVFMCGPAGSGKSTVARELEADGMTRLSFDQEAWVRGLRSMPLPADDHADIAAHLRRRLLELVAQGRDVVLDFSFWSRDMRDDWRRLLAPHGVVPDVVYLATDRQTCLDRIRARALSHGDDFALAPEVAARYFDHFQPPTADEGPLTIRR
ncbi:ATP-binding protein [Tessaracoccus sp. MC1756]|uniref:AAA family ATPase n=1 Tax=Tessaracoccus sp. MC1756 TaxID=2760311 RepID=UPI001C728A4D|nr:ATP-binding protein [Tessaracoccus sp. MC1756]